MLFNQNNYKFNLKNKKKKIKKKIIRNKKIRKINNKK